MRSLTEDDVRALVKKRAAPFAKNRGSTDVTAWAKRHGVATGNISAFMAGKRPSSTLLGALGLEWRIVRKN